MTEVIYRPRAASGSFSRAAVEELSASQREPSWLLDRRLAALAIFERTPVPTRAEEDYRRTDLRRFNIEEFAPIVGQRSTAPSASTRGLAPAVRAVLGGASRKGGVDGGTMVQQNGTVLFQTLSEELAAKGVIFCSLAEAVDRHPDLVRPYLTDERIGGDVDKWTSMNSAFWTGGVFIYVPKNVEVTLPLRTVFAQSGTGATSTKTLVIAEAWSTVTYLDDCLSVGNTNAPAFNTSVIDVVAGEGSAVRYCHIQNWGTNVWNFERERFFCKRDAAINTLQVGLGSHLTKSYVQTNIDEPGVSAEMLGLVFIGGKQHIDHTTLQNHIAGQSMSDLLFKCAMLEQARSVYGGKIVIAVGAQRSDAYQNNRNLLLSSEARADSIPMLEIEANDVRCTHGATVSSVDAEELFYLQSRGLPRAEAERMIVEGFFSPVIDRIPLVGVRERLAQEIASQLGKLKFG